MSLQIEEEKKPGILARIIHGGPSYREKKARKQAEKDAEKEIYDQIYKEEYAKHRKEAIETKARLDAERKAKGGKGLAGGLAGLSNGLQKFSDGMIAVSDQIESSPLGGLASTGGFLDVGELAPGDFLGTNSMFEEKKSKGKRRKQK